MIKRLFPQALRMPERLRVFGLGIQETMRPGMVHRPAGGPRELVIFFYTEAHAEAGGRRTVLPPHSLMRWSPGMPQWYGHPSRPWNHAWVAFDGPAAKRLLKAHVLPPGRPVPGDAGAFEFYLNGFHREMADRARPDPGVLENLFENWTRELARSRAEDAGGPPHARRGARPVPSAYRELRRYLHEAYDQPLTLDALAERLHVSRWHLCRAFKRCFGQTPMDCLQAIRMEHAAFHLRDVNLSVGEVARRCGYEDVFHFSKQFKKHYGVSPRGLRKRAWKE